MSNKMTGGRHTKSEYKTGGSSIPAARFCFINELRTDVALPPRLKGIEVVGSTRSRIYPGECT